MIPVLRYRAWVLLLIAVALAWSPARPSSAQAVTPEQVTAALAQLDTLAQDAMARTGGPGMAIVEGIAAQPWVPIGSFAPAGATLANLTDMAASVRLQLRRGVAAAGARVVSARNLEECWQPHIDMPTSSRLDPDLISAGYAMGWIMQTFNGGRPPYKISHGRGKRPNLMQAMNEANLAFVVHVGDIEWSPRGYQASKTGTIPCTDATFAERKWLFHTSTHPSSSRPAITIGPTAMRRSRP